MARLSTGLSPRLRGNRYCHPNKTSAPQARVYPRACGGTRDLRGGLSPRLRTLPCSPRWVYPRACGGTFPGNVRRPIDPHIRSIPAPAGEPQPSPFIRMIYPRPAGEPFVVRLIRALVRSIPAPAGEPSRRRIECPTRQTVYPRACGGTLLISYRAVIPVYPRACGGTRWPTSTWYNPLGLSPRLRGNLAVLG